MLEQMARSEYPHNGILKHFLAGKSDTFLQDYGTLEEGKYHSDNYGENRGADDRNEAPKHLCGTASAKVSNTPNERPSVCFMVCPRQG
jgi:hypothetical protein